MPDEEHEPRIFTLTEAERTRREVEPVLLEAMNSQRKRDELEQSLAAISHRIQLQGGVVIAYEKAAKLRMEFNRLTDSVKSSLERIEATGCVVKDIDVGLLDFPAIVNNEEVYLCWRVGEDRIRFYHRQDEGFAGRKPLDPRDRGPSQTVQ